MTAPVRHAIAVIALIVVATHARADEALSVSTSVSDERVLTGDVVTLEVNVVSHTDGNIELSIPQMDGLTELSRSKSEGTSIQWTNGAQQITKEYTVSIELQAEKAGKLTIPAITATAGRHQGASRPLTISVGANEDQNTEAPTAEAGKVLPPQPGEERIFLRYRVDRSEAYVGQQIILDLDVYTQPTMNFAIEEAPPPPALDGFWKEILDQPQRLSRRIETVNGRSYHAYRLWRVALFPIESGERTIPTGTMTFAVNRSIFGGGQRDRRRVPPMKLDILPLPTEGKPNNFSGQNVGIYTLTAKLDRDKVPAGKALVLTVQLSGRGNVKNTRLPELGDLDGIREFAPTITDKTDIDGDGLYGTKSAEILLMPERGGRLEIPSIDMTIFNPVEKRYQRLETGTMRVVVEGDPTQVAGETIPPRESATNIVAESNDPTAQKIARPSLRPLRYRSTLGARKTLPWTNDLFLAFFIAPPLLFVAVRLGAMLYALSRRETATSRRRAKTKQARTRLSKARAAVHAGDTGAAYREMREALLDFGSEKLGKELRGMTIDEARTAFAAKHAPASLIDAYVREMEAADYVQFAPHAIDQQTLEGAADRWETLFAELAVLK